MDCHLPVLAGESEGDPGQTTPRGQHPASHPSDGVQPDTADPCAEVHKHALLEPVILLQLPRLSCRALRRADRVPGLQLQASALGRSHRFFQGMGILGSLVNVHF